jgi:hypothetical protein
MDGQFGLCSTRRDATLVRMLQSYENEIQEIARTEHLVRQRYQSRPSLYNQILSQLGDLLVESGTRLKAHYSVQQVYRN